MKKRYTAEEFKGMVAELESQLFAAIAKSEDQAAQSTLAKSEESEEKAEDKKEDEKKEESAEATPAASEEKKEDKTPEAPKKDEDKKEDSDEDSHGYDEEDMEEMSKMYDSMSKGELKAHKSAMEKCWMAKCGDQTKMDMAKSEETVKATPESKPVVEETTLLKSELETKNKEIADLKKSVEGLVSAINTYVTKKAPARKAITDIEFVAKSEEKVEEKPLAKSEIIKILNKKASTPNLSSSDRAAINDYCLNNGSMEKIQHLIKQ